LPGRCVHSMRGSYELGHHAASCEQVDHSAEVQYEIGGATAAWGPMWVSAAPCHKEQLHYTLCSTPLKQGTWRLRSAEEIFATLEDHSVTLSGMKASKYYLVFEQVGVRCAGMAQEEQMGHARCGWEDVGHVTSKEWGDGHRRQGGVCGVVPTVAWRPFLAC
jgi:hypothetical protein